MNYSLLFVLVFFVVAPHGTISADCADLECRELAQPSVMQPPSSQSAFNFEQPQLPQQHSPQQQQLQNGPHVPSQQQPLPPSMDPSVLDGFCDTQDCAKKLSESTIDDDSPIPAGYIPMSECKPKGCVSELSKFIALFTSVTTVVFLILHYAITNKAGEKILKAKISQLDQQLFERNEIETVLQLTSLVHLESQLSEANENVKKLTQQVKDLEQQLQDEKAALQLRISELEASDEAIYSTE